MATLARGNLQGHHAGRMTPALADFFGVARLKQPVTRAITVKLVLGAGEYLHEHYHGRLYAKALNLRSEQEVRSQYPEACPITCCSLLMRCFCSNGSMRPLQQAESPVGELEKPIALCRIVPNAR